MEKDIVALMDIVLKFYYEKYYISTKLVIPDVLSKEKVTYSDKRWGDEKVITAAKKVIEMINECKIFTSYDLRFDKKTLSTLGSTQNALASPAGYEIVNIGIYLSYNKEILDATKDLNIAKQVTLEEIKNSFMSESSTLQQKEDALENLYSKFLDDDNVKKALIDKIGKDTAMTFHNFLNRYRNIRHSNGTEPTENELKVYFDFGLSLVRLAKEGGILN
jgi:hypothetical protein